MPSIKRLEEKREDLDEAYEKLRKKLRKIRKRYIIETDTGEQFKLEEEIEECKEKIEEIEEEIDDIDVKIKSHNRLKSSSVLNKGESNNELYKALLKLGYWEQQRLFEKIVITQKESHGAFLIHGQSKDYGQRWLLHRLARVVSKEFEGKNIVIDLDRTTLRTDVSSIWEDFAIWVDLEDQSTPCQIVTRIFKLWQSQNVLICFNNVNRYIEDNLIDLMDSLWTTLVENISDNKQHRFKLLVFFLDYQGIVRSWKLGFVTDYEPNYKTRFPFDLPELVPFSAEVLRNWLEQQSDHLPETISLDKEETIQRLLEKKGIPEPTIRKICALCGCNWFEQEKKWLPL